MRKILTLAIVSLFSLATVVAFADVGPPPDAGPGPALVDDAGPYRTAAVVAPPSDAGTVATADPADAGMPGSFEAAIKAVKDGDWRLVSAFVLAGLMVALRRARDRVSWFKGDRGGAVLVMLLSMFGALSTSLAAGVSVDAKLFLSAAMIAWTAVGGYTWLRRLIWPKQADPTPPTAETAGGV